MMRLTNLIVVLSLALGTAPAALLTVDSDFGPATVTYDSATGLRWLDLTVTAGLSWDEVLTERATGRMFSGWRYATQFELRQLYANAGVQFVDVSSSVDVDAVRALMNLLGGPLGHGVGWPWEDDRTLGYYGLDDFGNATGSALYITYFSPDDIRAYAGVRPSFSSLTDSSIPATGHWLVEAAVPEPSTFNIVLLGGVISFWCRLLRRHR